MSLQLCIVKDRKAAFTLHTSTCVDVRQKDALSSVTARRRAWTCGDACWRLLPHVAVRCWIDVMLFRIII